MEAVPRLPMLSFDLKPSAESVEFGPKLRQYIRDHYNEDPDNYSTEIHELEGLRAGAIHAPRDFTGCSTLKRYYCQLHFLLSRFPLSENSTLAITFNWYDIYSSLSYSVTDIKYEMACILYNIGALHTDLGAMDARNTPDGMKISCTHFQCAAWAFQHLRDTYPQPRESDMNPTLLTFFYNVCLAQAQECILEKSMTDNRKPTIIAKVAMQVVEYLKTAMKNLGSAKNTDAVITEIVGSKKLKTWRKYCEFKISYYGAVALLYQGMQAEEQQKMGERLAYYQAAVDMLNESAKLSKNLEKQEDELTLLNKAAQCMNETNAPELISESLTFSNDVMGGKLTAAQKENEFVYHEKVPPASSLAEVKGASLVKGIPFSVNDPEVAGQDIFSKLVPMEAHQHSSMYSEEKAKLLRCIGGEIQEKDEELETYLASMQLDSLSLDESSEALPQELVECCADLNASNGVRKLSDIMIKISNYYHDIDAALKTVHSIMEDEEQKEKEFLTMMGKRAPNMILGEMKREATKYREAHQSAQDNNTALHRAITTHMQNLQALSKPLDQIVAMIPSASEVEGQGDPATKQEVKRLMGKVSEMRSQRTKWEDQLRKDIHEDDVTKQLVTNQEDMEEFFKNELKKHDKLVNLLHQNMAAQNNILQALSEANAAYATTRRMTNQIQAQRTEMISSLLASYDAYLNILKKAEDAQEFYNKLEGQVNKLLTRVKSVCRVQDEEREEVLSANVKKFTGGTSVPKMPGAPVLPPGKPPSSLDSSSSSTTSGPKLKDYLQHMKGGPSSSTSAVPSGVMPSSGGVPSSHMGMPTYGYSDPSASYTSNMRPAPLGSEQGDARASGAGQMPSGYPSTYGAQASAYQPSAPSPAPSPAPHISGSPRKTPMPGSPYGSASPYYSPQQMGSMAYSTTSTSVQPTSTIPSNSTASSTSGVTMASTYPSASTNTASRPASHYGYNSQYPPSNHQANGGPSSHTTSTLSSNSNSQLKLPGVSPSHGAAAAPQQNPYQNQQPQYGQGSITSPTTEVAGASAVSGSTYPSGSGYVPQSYYGYYQQQQHRNASSTATSNVATATTTTQAGTSHPSYPSSSASASSQGNTQYPNTYPQSQGTTATPAPTATQTSGSQPGYSNQNVGNYPGQQGYTSVASSYYPSHTSPAQPGYANQVPAGYPSSYTNQSVNTYPSQPPTTTATTAPAHSTGDATTQSSDFHPFSTTAPNQWNMYGGFSPRSVTSFTNSQAGSAGTVTSQMGGTQGTNHSYPYSHSTSYSATTTTTPSTAGASGGQVSTQTAYSTTGVQGQTAGQYSQGASYQHYAQQQQWAQYRTPQSHLPQSHQIGAHQHPQQSHPQPQQQTPQQPQRQPTLQQPSQPQQQLPQQQPQQPHQHYAQQVQPQKPQQPSQPPQQQPVGISNLDLLSGIELTSPPNTQWSPLTPQPAGGGGRQSSEQANNSGQDAVAPTVPSQHSSSAPDVTSSASSASQMPASVGSNLPNVVSSNTAITDTPSDTSSGAVSSSILDITALAKNRKQTVVDPLSDDERLQKLAVETERLSKMVEGLDRKSLNGPTNLDLKWKELSDVVDKECGELKVSVARCYPLKNRFADILPYDHTRVKLPSARDDYINASHVQIKSTDQSFPLILTQAPMPATFVDFWTMVWEQQVEIIVCLNSEAEVKGQIYWPSDTGVNCDFGQISVTLHSSCEGSSPVSYRRVLHIAHKTSKLTRVIIHMQFLGWPPSAMPESPGLLLQFLSDVHTFQRQQRNKLREVVVHCVPGLGRSSVFTVLSAYMRELFASGTLMDLFTLLVDLNKQRRGGIQDKDHLHFAYSAALYFAQDVLMKRGILTNKATFEEGPREKTHVRHPSADLLSAYDFSRLKSKLGLDQETGKSGSDEELSRRNSSASLVSNGSAGFDQALKDAQREASKESLASASSTGLADSGCDASSVDANDSSSALDSKSNGLLGKPSSLIDPSVSSIAPSLAASLDPQQFKIDPPVPAKFTKITKESFENVSGGSLSKASKDPKDPFSGLDPLWSHKKC